jgi:nitroimidazol reductase NimA-like FMN-containing flavoprotein (pyridoxamine 5'-phosphate oxidase superfamily)
VTGIIEHPVEEIADDQCWAFLESTDLGRLGVRAGDGVDIFPINYLVKDRVIYFGSAPGSKLADLTKHPLVAFEVDGVADRQRWSVVIRGRASRLSLQSEIEYAGIHDFHSQTPVDKWNYVRITPEVIGGRRFTAIRRVHQHEAGIADGDS